MCSECTMITCAFNCVDWHMIHLIRWPEKYTGSMIPYECNIDAALLQTHFRRVGYHSFDICRTIDCWLTPRSVTTFVQDFHSWTFTILCCFWVLSTINGDLFYSHRVSLRNPLGQCFIRVLRLDSWYLDIRLYSLFFLRLVGSLYWPVLLVARF